MNVLLSVFFFAGVLLKVHRENHCRPAVYLVRIHIKYLRHHRQQLNTIQIFHFGKQVMCDALFYSFVFVCFFFHHFFFGSIDIVCEITLCMAEKPLRLQLKVSTNKNYQTKSDQFNAVNRNPVFFVVRVIKSNSRLIY